MKLRKLSLVGLLFAASGTSSISSANWADRLRGVTTPTPETVDDVRYQFGEEYETLSAALRELLLSSSDAALQALGQRDGFLNQPEVKIPLPGLLEDSRTLLVGGGLMSQVDQLERSFNRIAEYVTAESRMFFVEAIATLSIDDSRALMVGSPDAASRYLRRLQGNHLAEQTLPLIREQLAARNETNLFSDILEQASIRIPTLSSLQDLDVAEYINQRLMEGIFWRMGREERNLRENS